MITITATLSSLTAFIIHEGERLHLSYAEATIQNDAPCPLDGLTFVRTVDRDKILQRLAKLSGLSVDRIAPNLGILSATCPYFILVKQTADIYIPPYQYDRIQAAIHRIGMGGSISFTLNTLDSISAVPPLTNADLPNPLALLFLLEHQILCQSMPRLEIGVSPGLSQSLAAPISPCGHVYLQPCG